MELPRSGGRAIAPFLPRCTAGHPLESACEATCITKVPL